jgi:5-methylcytosine-specific restriction endonuclease McrA
MSAELPVGRGCLRAPASEIAEAAQYLDDAVTAHQEGRPEGVRELLRRANMQAIREWTESLWGPKSQYRLYRSVPDAPPFPPKGARVEDRMPPAQVMTQLITRDGYHCRFCGIPVIRREVRKRIVSTYPDLALWGRTNASQHAAFQAMWLQYDHLLPYARGGDSGLDNMIITCAPCNFGRMQYTLEEVGLINPLSRAPVPSPWDGLERFR